MTDEANPPDLDVSFPTPEGLLVTSDRPFSILLVRDFAGGEEGTLAGPLREGLVPLRAEDFAGALAGARPTVRFKTTDPVAGGNVLAEVALTFDTLKSFAPAAIVQQVPQTRALHDAREQIVARLHGKIAADALAADMRDRVQRNRELAWLTEALQWKPQAAAEESAVDDLLGQFDLGDSSSESPPRSPTSKLVSSLAGGGAQVPAPEASALRRALAQIDQRLSAWVTQILHAPQVQAVEGAWRGLHFLVSKLDFRAGMRVTLLHTSREDLPERLTHLVIDPVFDEGAPAPDLIIVDALFGQASREIELLDELAQHAASLPVVALAGVSADFFAVKHAWQVPTLPPLGNHFKQWQFAKYKTLREQRYARSLGLIFGRGLLRAPYDDSEANGNAFRFVEKCVGEADFLWTSGALAAACTIADSVVRTGWPTGVVGQLGGFAAGMGGKKGDKRFGPADTTMPLDKAQEMATAGLNAMIGVRDGMDAVICNGFSVARPERTEGFAPFEVSLPYQLFATRLSSLLLDLKPHLLGKDADQLAAIVLAHMRNWLHVENLPADEQQIAVQARALDDQPESLQLAVTVTPPPNILPGGVPVVLGYRVR